ncbi:NAD(P)H-dependent glycerol-3-phosphate dehydrogenase [Bacteroidetes/Chlorobi group bacterium ChocPot_Mid]|nr:MAG: NAD(P)H-dependent glycerol-3-phosphate dehydrogenase [Bacteroidetes/Chlorobi group bacterium ChocPot_Mid]
MFGHQKIGIIGAGGWGTSVAKVLSENSHKVILWSHEKDVVEEINKSHTNSKYLPGVLLLNSHIKASYNVSDLRFCDFYVLAVPTQHIREVFELYKFHLKDKIIVNLSKGIEKNTLMRVSQILRDVAGVSEQHYVVLTGPSHAEEVSRCTPTTIVAASEVIENARQIQNIFSNKYFRVYTSEDVIGCEIGGALKNVIAIAAGIIDGLGIGDNTKAALITRGLAGMGRLGVALGANHKTFFGLSGLGDLVVTCNSKHSRNRYVGEQIGKGRKLKEILSEMKMIAEGVETTISAYQLSQKHQVELPITEQVHRILFDDVNPLEAIANLMTRETKHEWWW